LWRRIVSSATATTISFCALISPAMLTKGIITSGWTRFRPGDVARRLEDRARLHPVISG